MVTLKVMEHFWTTVIQWISPGNLVADSILPTSLTCVYCPATLVSDFLTALGHCFWYSAYFEDFFSSREDGQPGEHYLFCTIICNFIDLRQAVDRDYISTTDFRRFGVRFLGA